MLKCVFVDDEPNVLNAMKRHLETQYLIETCTTPEKALTHIANDPEVAIVVTDYNMPRMNGVDFLKALQSKAPGVIPVMLTGVADFRAAKDAVNSGHVFRFLSKPCTLLELTAALGEASAKYAADLRERELLESTLSASIKVLTDILAHVDPAGLESNRTLRQDAREIAKRVDGVIVWEAELAIALRNLGFVAFPAAVNLRSVDESARSEVEREVLHKIPVISADLVQQVPRLEGVAEIIRLHKQPVYNDSNLFSKTIPPTARLVGILVDLFELTSRGVNRLEALRRLSLARSGQYDTAILKIVKEYYLASSESRNARLITLQVRVEDLVVGSRPLNDLRTKDGILLVSAGTALDAATLELLRNHDHVAGLEEQPQIEVAMG